MDAAIREFQEETGIEPHGEYIALGSIKQKGGKVVHAWAFKGDHDESQPVRSNPFEMQWPPGSGQYQSFPEVDQARFFFLSEAQQKLKDTQWPLVERLVALLKSAAEKG